MEIIKPEYIETFEPGTYRVKNPVVRFLGGLKLGLTLLTLLTIASSIGEFLPHENEMSLKLVFTTWWYRALLAAMGINLICNTWVTWTEETYPQFLPIFRKNPDHYNPLKVKNKVKFDATAASDPKTLMQALATTLSLKGYRTFFDGTSLYGHRGLLARFGSSITHLGLIVIISGALVESFFKQDGVVTAIEGQEVDYYKVEGDNQTKHPLGFSVKVQDFEFTKYPGVETAQKFKSTVTYTPKNGKPLNTYVRVNHDVTYGGWTFHQSSYTELQKQQGGESFERYYVGLEQKAKDGAATTINFETYVSPGTHEITPLPGHDDLFFAVEEAPGEPGVVWTVTNKEKILARGVKPLLDYHIELVKYLPSFKADDHGGVLPGDSAGGDNPAALVEIVSGNEIQFRQWVFKQGRSPFPPQMQSQTGLDFVIADVAKAPNPGAAGSGPMDGDGAMTVVTLNLLSQGQATGRTFKLKPGEPQAMAGEVDNRYEIPGDFRLKTFSPTPAYATHMSVSKNPGIPIVWMGSIFASLGPVIAFFVSRRRVWAFVDWTKKTVWIGGESRYSREALEDEVAVVIGEWAAAPEAAIKPEPKIARKAEIPRLSIEL